MSAPLVIRVAWWAVLPFRLAVTVLGIPIVLFLVVLDNDLRDDWEDFLEEMKRFWHFPDY